MADLLVVVLDDLSKFQPLLEAWEAAGVPGATVVESLGSRKLVQGASRDDVPLMPSLRDLFARHEVSNRLLFTVIDSKAVLKRAIRIAEETIEDIPGPDTGILFVVPVSQVIGVPRRQRKKKT